MKVNTPRKKLREINEAKRQCQYTELFNFKIVGIYNGRESRAEYSRGLKHTSSGISLTIKKRTEGVAICVKSRPAPSSRRLKHFVQGSRKSRGTVNYLDVEIKKRMDDNPTE